MSDHTPENDANYQAFLRDMNNGELNKLEPGTFVAYIHGIFKVSAPSYEELGLDPEENLDDEIFVHQLGTEKQVHTIHRGPRLASNRQ